MAARGRRGRRQAAGLALPPRPISTRPSYDAVFAVAHARGLVDGTDGADGVDGDALHAAILATNFTGATGAVGLDAHGDHGCGVRYDVFSVSNGCFFQLGAWVERFLWADRFTQAANASYVSVTARRWCGRSRVVVRRAQAGRHVPTAELRAGGARRFSRSATRCSTRST